MYWFYLAMAIALEVARVDEELEVLLDEEDVAARLRHERLHEVFRISLGRYVIGILNVQATVCYV